MSIEETVDPLQTAGEMIGRHADTDANMLLDAEPGAGTNEDALLGAQAHAQCLGRHGKIIRQKRHAAGARLGPAPAIVMREPGTHLLASLYQNMSSAAEQPV